MAILRYLPQGGTKPRSLIILLHGVGGDAATMESLARALHRVMIDAAIVVPDAPFSFDLGQTGYQWFSVKGVTSMNRDARIQNAIPVIQALIHDEAQRLGLTQERIGVCGFSQGAMMALALADQPHAPAFVASIAGRLAREPNPQTNPKPYVFLTHGTSDQVVPFSCMSEAAIALQQADYPVTALAVEGQGHLISPTQARAVCDFFANAFNDALEVMT